MGTALSLCYERNDDMILKVRTLQQQDDITNKIVQQNEDNNNNESKEDKGDSAVTMTITNSQPSSKQITYESNASSPRSFRSLQLLKPDEENYYLKNLIVKGDLDNLKDFIQDDEDKINIVKFMRFDFKNYHSCHIAVIKGNLPMLKYLIEIGSDPNLLDLNNNNCINIAYQHRNIVLIEYLLSLQLQPYYELEQFLSSTPTSLGSRYVSDDDENNDKNCFDERSRSNSNSCDSTEYRTPCMSNFNPDKYSYL